MKDALKGRNVNVVCVGAQKSGTTTLYTILTKHPEFTFARIKEVQYFATDPYTANHLAYHANYRGREPNRWIADFTPRYLAHPDAASRIAAYNPDTHIIVLLRDPVQRAISHYQMKIRNGNEKRPFAEVVQSDIDALKKGITRETGQSVVGRGLYAAQIARYDALFPKSQIHLMRFEELVDHQEATVNALLEKLGSVPISLSETVHANPAFEPQLKRVWKVVSHLPMVYTARLRMFLRNQSRRSIAQTAPQVDEATLKLLRTFYREDLLALQERTGWDLTDWMMNKGEVL
jgi:hypothetical protein